MADPTFTVNGEVIPVPQADSLRFKEAVAAEKLYGGSFQQLTKDAEAGSLEALGVLLFLGYRRLHPEASWADFDFALADLAADVEVEEAPAVPTEAAGA
jgi:hypothetical protein